MIEASFLREERDFDPLPMRELIFVLTERCNLNCTYCYEKYKNKSSRSLSARFIKDRIRECMLADDDAEEVWVDFFGGEPLLEFGTIREVVDWLVSVQWPEGSPAALKSFRFLVETNGTLLTQGMKEWFSSHRNHLVVGLSLDGTKEAHDRNRSNSYDQVVQHLDFFRENWPLQPVKMTVGPETIDKVYDGVLNIHRMGLQVDFDVVFEDVWGDEASEARAVRSWAAELAKLIVFYRNNPELKRPMVLSRKLEFLFDRPTERKRTFCGAGKYVTSYLPDETKYPCFRLSPIAVAKPITDVMLASYASGEECATCPFERICTTCEGHNYSVTGSCFSRTRFHCRFFKISLLSCARLMMLDHAEHDMRSVDTMTKDEQKESLRRLLIVRTVNDFCTPVLDWASAFTS